MHRFGREGLVPTFGMELPSGITCEDGYLAFSDGPLAGEPLRAPTLPEARLCTILHLGRSPVSIREDNEGSRLAAAPETRARAISTLLLWSGMLLEHLRDASIAAAFSAEVCGELYGANPAPADRQWIADYMDVLPFEQLHLEPMSGQALFDTVKQM